MKEIKIRPLDWRIQLTIWCILFILPFMFLQVSDHIYYWSKYFIDTCIILFVFLSFYASYLWLTPKYFLTGEKRRFFIFGTLFMIIMSVLLHLFLEFSVRYIISTVDEGPLLPPLATAKHFLLILRNMLTIAISMGIATALTLSMNYVKMERCQKETVAAMRESELKNLRNQIHPHFLLNTLNNIYALTGIDQQKAQVAILELSNMLRYILYENQESTVSVKKEVAFLHNYITLMRMRFPESVEVKEDMDVPESCSATIAPMILISLVENAFKHGISSTEKGFIHLNLKVKDEKLHLTIENSNFPKLENDHSGHGIGLEHIQKRLELSYPNKYEWEHGVCQQTNTYFSKLIIRLT